MEETIYENIDLVEGETTNLGTIIADIDETIVQATVQDENGNLYNNEHTGLITQNGTEKGSSAINNGALDIPIYVKNGNDLLLALSGPAMQDSTLEMMISQAGIFDMGTLIINSMPSQDIIIMGKVYDLNSKWSANGERLPTQGMQGQKVYLKSNPENYVLTNAEGIFEMNLGTEMPGLMVDSTFQGSLPPTYIWKMQVVDSLFVEGLNPEDTTHYFFKTPIGQKIWREKVSNGTIWEEYEVNPINVGTNNVIAFRDTTGIALFERYIDPENGVDMLEHLQYVANIEESCETNPYWHGAKSRPKDEDLVGGIKVFLNRDNATTTYYANKAWEGLKAAEVGRFKFQETNDSANALLVMTYNNDMVGQGINKELGYNETDGYYAKHWEISLRGSPNGPALSEEETKFVNAHESYHIAYWGGKHSPYIQDVFFLDALTRMDEGIPLQPTIREAKGITILYNLELNSKPKQWFK